jgi:hypothetical protein
MQSVNVVVSLLSIHAAKVTELATDAIVTAVNAVNAIVNEADTDVIIREADTNAIIGIAVADTDTSISDSNGCY